MWSLKGKLLTFKGCEFKQVKEGAGKSHLRLGKSNWEISCFSGTIAVWCSSDGKESVCNAGVLGSTPGLGRSPGEGNTNPFQYHCLENPMDRGAWQATVHGIARVRHNLATKERERAVW